MVLLRRLASETGVIIITSVHQPSSRVFDSFDQVRARHTEQIFTPSDHEQTALVANVSKTDRVNRYSGLQELGRCSHANNTPTHMWKRNERENKRTGAESEEGGNRYVAGRKGEQLHNSSRIVFDDWTIQLLPPSRLSQVILMTMGQTAYFGSAADSLGHFAKLGLEPAGLVNPADYLLEVSVSGRKIRLEEDSTVGSM